jgi:hypothetical protein
MIDQSPIGLLCIGAMILWSIALLVVMHVATRNKDKK